MNSESAVIFTICFSFFAQQQAGVDTGHLPVLCHGLPLPLQVGGGRVQGGEQKGSVFFFTDVSKETCSDNCKSVSSNPLVFFF